METQDSLSGVTPPHGKEAILVEKKNFTLVFGIVQLGIFGWQTAVIKGEKDREGNRVVPHFGTFGSMDKRYPGYFEEWSYTKMERFYTGLFVVQILILIVSFFLLFAAVALIYGIHTNSKYLVWPWFPCMITNILCCIAYCILWWTGVSAANVGMDVRNYWMVLTIIEMIGVIINIYCLLCVIVQYKRISKGRGDPTVYYYEPTKEPVETTVYYNNNGPGGASVKPVMQGQYEYDPYNQGGQLNWGYDQDQKVGIYGGYDGQPMAEELPQKTPIDPNQTLDGQDFTRTWLNSQQQLALQTGDPNAYMTGVEDSGGIQHANTEPSSPTKDAPPQLPLHPSKSVPSILEDEKSKKRRHRSHSVSSRKSHRSYRTRSSYSDGDSSDSDGRSRSRHGSRRRGHSHSRDRHRSSSKDKGSDSDYTSYSEKEGKRHRRKHHKHHHHKSRHDDDDRNKRKNRRPRDVKRDDKERDKSGARPGTSTSTDQSTFPHGVPPKYPGHFQPGGGITIPQHIVIPPTKPGAKSDQPQRFHINSEIVISYSDRSTNPSVNPSDNEGRLKYRNLPSLPSNGQQVNMRPNGPTVTSPQDDDEPYRQNRESYGAESSDSKGAGSTAV